MGVPEKLRRVHYYDAVHANHLYFLTNNFAYQALTIAELYKKRWEIELFFRWIKQNLRIKSFVGTSENAVMTQVWVAMILYLLLSFINWNPPFRPEK
jgi:IS4 transposase